jgi:hypothetical protein
MIFDKYNRIARLYPTILTGLPVLLLANDFLSIQLKTIIEQALIVNALIHAAFSIAVIYFLVQVNRLLGKELERLLFENELGFPTTTLLLTSSETLSASYKENIKHRIQADFNMDLNTQLESTNLTEFKIQIRDAVGLVRSKVKNGHLLLQHNYEYGFVRNLVGGSFFAALIAVISLFVYEVNTTKFVIHSTLAIVYLVILVVSKPLLNRFSTAYAKRLFQEYLSIEKK